MKLLLLWAVLTGFTQPDLSYLWLDARTSEVLDVRWDDVERPAPPGSLVKPFTALAWGARNVYRYPAVVCDGTQCWYARGHGRLDLAGAIGYSCNSYFAALARDLESEDLRPVCERFGLGDPPSRGSLIGLGGDWNIAPLALARAYAEMARCSGEPGIAEIMRGMALSARRGTGQRIGVSVLTKTGTSPCIHRRAMPGDGYTIAIDPGRAVLLVRVHGVPGAEAAATAGRMLRAIAGRM